MSEVRPARPAISPIRPAAVSPQVAARLMCVSASTIKRLVKAGKLPAIRVGRQVRIFLTDLKRGTV